MRDQTPTRWCPRHRSVVRQNDDHCDLFLLNGMMIEVEKDTPRLSLCDPALFRDAVVVPADEPLYRIDLDAFVIGRDANENFRGVPGAYVSHLKAWGVLVPVNPKGTA